MNRTQKLKEELETIKSNVNEIATRASDEERNLTEDEVSQSDTLLARADDIASELEPMLAREERLAAASAVAAKVQGYKAPSAIAVRSNVEPITAGEFLSNALKVQDGQMSADEHLSRAAMVSTDNAGIVPEPIVGDLISLYDATRPVWNSFASRPMPASGSTFTRPKITQHVVTGDQAAELDAVASQKMTIGGDPVAKFTEAGYLDLSEQDIDWTDPSALQLVVQDFARAYSRRMETRASAFLPTLATATATYSIASVGAAVESFVDAFLDVDTSAEEEADTIWIAKNAWADLAKLTNAGDDRTAISMIQEALATYGVSAPRWVVGRQLAADTVIVGSGRLVESYEQNKGLLQIAQPSVLGQRVAYRGYGALFGTAAGFVSLETV